MTTKNGPSEERARRWFLQHYGMTFVAWCRGRRLANAFTQIREGAPLDDVIRYAKWAARRP